MTAVTKPIITVQMRELMEFVHRTGDLGGEGLFMGPNRALAGTLGHQWLQKSRPAHYQKEVRLSHEVGGAEFILRVQGRLDGVFAEPSGVRLEEIKTVGHGWDGTPDPLHWAQAKGYAFIYAHDHQLATIAVQLTYLHLDTRQTTEFCEIYPFAELAAFFAATVSAYQQWTAEQLAWRKLRDQSIAEIKFPFAQYRPGQRKLAVAVYRALTRGERLFLEAPTGIGKTISTLFPAVKVLGEGKLERIFYLTATTVGRLVAEKAAADLRNAGLRLRSLTLTARSKLCVQNGRPCDPQTCPRALGYYDRVKPALLTALAGEEINRPMVEAIGQEYQVCPFELSLDLSEWVDVVIGDYNYVFDPQVYLRRHFAAEGGAYGFLVDEAHNLVDRAREMFSADLNSEEITGAARSIRASLPKYAKVLDRLGRAWRKFAESGTSIPENTGEFSTDAEPDLFRTAPGPAVIPGRQMMAAEARYETRVIREFPAELRPLLETALETIAEWLAKNELTEFRPALLELFFRLNAFIRTADLSDERYVTLLEPEKSARITLFCVDPSNLLRQAMVRGRGTIFFSATLAPVDYYRRLLGGEETDAGLQLASPFPPANLCVLVHSRIRTDFKARADSLAEVVRAIGAFVSGRAGNYLVYLPSYPYLMQVVEGIQATRPDLPVVVQRPGMSEAEREQFLSAFAAAPGRTLVGFAVLGGIFGEGIDLVGERLIGAVVVGVGLPQLDAERAVIADYFQERSGAGFDYACTFPGMNRVLQATGRVIRSETDRGAVLLIDTRFREGRYRRLFPGWWQPVMIHQPLELPPALQRFWAGTASAL